MTAGRALAAAGGLCGAAGVAFAAAAAHQGGGEAAIASNFLLFHAPAFLAVGLAGRGQRPLLAAAWLLLAGVLVFSADLACRSYLGHRLFPFAAPTGGTLAIAGWLALAIALSFLREKG